jgi:phosphotriesterase-related protein
MGFTLTHEHILVDFIGADKYDPTRWDHEEVIRTVLPYLSEIKELGCNTFIDCTPEYIGRDPVLLKKLSEKTGLQIVTNTGFYGASSNKYMASFTYSETANQLALRWIKEFENGINNTGIKPGFMKIGVAPGPLSGLHKKLITAAAIAHQKTGMPIASHTGPAIPAFEQLDVLNSMNVAAEAFIWVHAQNEENNDRWMEGAQRGAWISLDGLNENNVHQYVTWLSLFKKEKMLNKVLISHDAGWYSPGEEGGGTFRPYSTVFKKLIPALFDNGFSDKDIKTIFTLNPALAFSIED